MAKWNDALAALKEALSTFDFDTADFIINDLNNYEIPKDIEELYKAIKTKIHNVDQAGTMQLLP